MGLLNYGKYARCARLLREDICTSNLKLRVLNGAFWVFVGTALAKAIVLIAGICCAQILNKEQYGELGMVRSTINMFVAFGVAGLGLTATKYISEYRASQKERIGSIYILTNGFAYITGALITIVVLLLSPNIASQSLQAPYLVNEIRLGGLLLFVTVINGAQNGTLVGFEKFRSIACNTFIGSLAESIGIILGSYYYGVSGAILGYGTGFLVLYIANYVSIRNVLENEGVEVHLSMFRLEDLNLLYRFSLPAMLSSIMVVPAFWLVRSMLVRSNGFDELAIYEAADQWKVVMLFIPTAISQIVLPILSSIVVGGNKGEYWWLLVVAVINSPKHDFNCCKSVIYKFLSRDPKSARDKNGTKPRKNKVKNTLPEISLVEYLCFVCKGTNLSLEKRGEIPISLIHNSFSYHCTPNVVIANGFDLKRLGLRKSGVKFCFALCWTFSKTRTGNRTKDLPPLLSNPWFWECLNDRHLKMLNFK